MKILITILLLQLSFGDPDLYKCFEKSDYWLGQNTTANYKS